MEAESGRLPFNCHGPGGLVKSRAVRPDPVQVLQVAGRALLSWPTERRKATFGRACLSGTRYGAIKRLIALVNSRNAACVNKSYMCMFV